MNCAYHPKVEAEEMCYKCKKRVCKNCIKFVKGKKYCYRCAQKILLENFEEREEEEKILLRFNKSQWIIQDEGYWQELNKLEEVVEILKQVEKENSGEEIVIKYEHNRWLVKDGRIKEICNSIEKIVDYLKQLEKGEKLGKIFTKKDEKDEKKKVSYKTISQLIRKTEEKEKEKKEEVFYCAWHKEVEAIGKCMRCEKYICDDCAAAENEEGQYLCNSCYSYLTLYSKLKKDEENNEEKK